MLSVIKELEQTDKRVGLLLEYYNNPEKTLRDFLKESGITRKEYRKMIVEYKIPTKEEYELEKEIDYLWDKVDRPLEEIMEGLGISRAKARIYQRAIQMSKGVREITKEEKEYKGMYDKGKTIPKIAVAKGVSETKVHKVLQGIDLRYGIDNQLLIKLRDNRYHEAYNEAIKETRSKPEIVRRLGLKRTSTWVVSLLEELEGTKGLKDRDVWTREPEIQKLYEEGYTIQEVADNTGVGKRTVNIMVKGMVRGVSEERKKKIAKIYDIQHMSITNVTDKEVIRVLTKENGKELVVQSLREYSKIWGEYEESYYKQKRKII